MELGATDSVGPPECSKIVFIMIGTLIKMSKKYSKRVKNMLPIFTTFCLYTCFLSAFG